MRPTRNAWKRGSAPSKPTGRGGVSDPRNGQALAEFALVFPLFMVIVGAIIQFGIIFWAQNTLTQVTRDTVRWAATQSDCTPAVEGSLVIATANDIATSAQLIGHAAGGFTAATVDVNWSGTCPPKSNADVGWVTVTIRHHVPLFFPFVPGNGDLATTAQARVEPTP